MNKFLTFLFIPLTLFATGWPVGDISQPLPVGNSWGEIQQYSSTPYLHPGVDVMGVVVGEPVYAVADGLVKSWLTISGDFHWRLAIADSVTNDSCNGWLYAHIDPARNHIEVGEWVEEGDLIGYLVEWPVKGFDHLHWARIRGAGANWSSDWRFVDNPSVDLDPPGDSLPPIFEETFPGELLGFRENNSSFTTTYLSPDSLYGDVDIISRIFDKTGEYWEDIQDTVWERLTPIEVSYEIHGAQNKESVRSFLFDGDLEFYDAPLEVIYSRDAECLSVGNYETRQYYFILTNTDGDSLREESDIDSCWHTADFVDGEYQVVVTASDAAGNTSVDSMKVILVNGNEPTAVTDSPESIYLFQPLSTVIQSGTHLSFISRSQADITFYDTSGRQIKTIHVTSSSDAQSLDLLHIGPGVYFYRVSTQPDRNFKLVVVN